mmetsp:Transcript_2516/g.6238  ORF Transcript_2516/g.6238 Transcript_2516/m.6238 type:complete len:207 (-) Transcript_2516:4-624(-)
MSAPITLPIIFLSAPSGHASAIASPIQTRTVASSAMVGRYSCRMVSSNCSAAAASALPPPSNMAMLSLRILASLLSTACACSSLSDSRFSSFWRVSIAATIRRTADSSFLASGPPFIAVFMRCLICAWMLASAITGRTTRAVTRGPPSARAVRSSHSCPRVRARPAATVARGCSTSARLAWSTHVSTTIRSTSSRMSDREGAGWSC